jgi:host factor-I protein
MQSFFEKRTTALDTSQPSIRHLQDLIRHKTPVAVQVPGVGEIEGILHWQDIHYLALKQDQNRPLTLISRASAATIRALG